MINLLPPEEKRQILAARSNSLLSRYCVVSLILAGLIVVFIGIMVFMLFSAKRQAESTIIENQQRASEYASVKKEADEFKDNLATAKAILDKDAHYKQVAVAIAQHIPPGIVLQSLDLNAATVTQPMKLTALAKTEHDAVRLKSSFENSGMFKNVYLDSVTLAVDASGKKPDYPVTISINVTLAMEKIQR